MTESWSTACPDWRERIVRGQSLLPCGPLFPAEAADALDVFRDLPIVDVIGKPTFGEIGRSWIFDLPTAVFGAYNPETGRREINEFFELIAKKNTKSTRAAGIMLTELVRNERHSAEFTILAPTLEIAKNSAEPAMDMAAEHPELKKILKPVAHQRLIEHRSTGAQLKIVAADSETVGGKKSTGVLIDELWLFGKRANAKNMLREATGGLASRPEGFVIALSTQSDEPPAGVFLDWLRRFRDIRDGTLVAPRSLGLLYEFPEEMIRNEAYKDPKNFYIPNPNLGASVDEQFLLDQFTTAQREGQRSLVGFLAKHLNVEPGMAGRSDGWAGAEFWQKQADPSLTLESLIARSEVIVAGIDGGGADDLFGLSVLGRLPSTFDSEFEEEIDLPGIGKRVVRQKQDRWLCWSHAWCHTKVFERRKSIASRLRDFERAGELTVVEDDLMDASSITAIIEEIDRRGKLGMVCVDPAGIDEFVKALEQIGVTQENKKLGGAPQGMGMMTAIKMTERRLAKGTLVHSGASIMVWAVGNLKIEPTATGIRATKQHAGDAKVDPVMSLFNAATGMMQNPETKSSVYEQEEKRLLVL